MNKKPIHKSITKPCKKCNYCPYGKLVEKFPLAKRESMMSCEIFGHECPAFFLAELVDLEQNQ